MTHDVKLGIGNVLGYFYHAPKNTALPAHPLAELDAAWENVGYVSEEGLTWHTGRTATPLKDFARQIVRQIQEDGTGTVQVPIISTTAEVLKTIFGEDHVTETAASADHGKLAGVEVEEGVVSGEEAFLFIMKDDDDAMMLGTTGGFITDLDDINFVPGDPITWPATISSSKWKYLIDDGQKTA